jgi:ATP-dependent Clp endopeptidase proteolytic subunit ClpP
MKEAYIRFMAAVTSQTSDRLMKLIDDKIHNGYEKIHLLISSPGGSVFHGLSLYNFLHGCPIEIDTYNFGSVDSIGVVLFCAGKQRYSVPNARFLIHGVSFTFQGSASFDEKMLDEQLKSLQIDQSNIAKVIAYTTNKKEEEIKMAMHNRTTLSPDEAKDYGLVTEIKNDLMPANAEFHAIGEFDQPTSMSMPQFSMQQIPMPMPMQLQFPPMGLKLLGPRNENYTSSFDRGFTFTDSYS